MTRVGCGFTVGTKDYEVFLYLFRHKIGLVYQICRDVYPTAHRVHVYQRLAKLCRHGYLVKDSTLFRGRSVICYRLSSKGLAYVQEFNPLDLREHQLKSDSQLHDYTVVDLLSVLQKLTSIQEILTENELVCLSSSSSDRSTAVFARQRSDAYLLVQLDGDIMHFAFEYEQSKKSAVALQSKIISYASSEAVDGIIYCVPDLRVLKYVREQIRNTNSNRIDKFLFCLRDDVLKSPKTLSLTTYAGDILTLA